MIICSVYSYLNVKQIIIHSSVNIKSCMFYFHTQKYFWNNSDCFDWTQADIK